MALLKFIDLMTFSHWINKGGVSLWCGGSPL